MGIITLTIVWLTAQPIWWVMLLITGAWLVLVLLLLVGALTWPGMAYRRTHYIVTPVGMEIHRGVIWRCVINVPRSRIQHTDVVQGPIMRRHDLAALLMHTAGTQNSTVTLEGLRRSTALALRDYLIQADGASASHDAV